MADNVVATLSYFTFIPAIIFLVLEPYNKNRTIRFHAFQSIFLNVLIIGIEIVFGIVLHILVLMLGFFGLLAGIFWPIFGLGCLCLWLYVVISTYQGKKIVLPIIGPLAEKQAQS
jgi:uncharacterized membrane protein